MRRGWIDMSSVLLAFAGIAILAYGLIVGYAELAEAEILTKWGAPAMLLVLFAVAVTTIEICDETKLNLWLHARGVALWAALLLPLLFAKCKWAPVLYENRLLPLWLAVALLLLSIAHAKLQDLFGSRLLRWGSTQST